MGKWIAKKITTQDGIFDSKAEYRRYLVLKHIETNGIIKFIDRQVEFELIPKHRTRHDKKLERAVNYTCDFLYIKDETLCIEDVKSDFTRKEKDYILRRKMFKYVYLNEEDTEYKKLHSMFPNLKFKDATFVEFII